MATLTEMVAAVVLHSSAAAFSHFGVTLEATKAEPAHAAVDQRVVARSPRKLERVERIEKASGCPDAPRASIQKA